MASLSSNQVIAINTFTTYHVTEQRIHNLQSNFMDYEESVPMVCEKISSLKNC